MFTYTKRKDGRLMKRVSVKGKLRTLYSDNPKNLEAQYIELKHLSNKGTVADDNNLSVGDWANKWVNLYKSDKEKATIKMYKDAIRLYIIPNIGNIKLKYLKQSDIVSMLNELDKKKITRKKDIALLTIKQILNKAVENDYISKNVALGIKQKKHKSAEKQPLTELEIEYLKKVAKNDNRAFMILFMLYTGLRKEEVAPIQYEDIDTDNKLLIISKAVHWEKNRPFVKNTKNEGIRKIPILDIIYSEVKNLKTQHTDKEIVFPSIKGKSIMSETSIRKVLEHTLKEINKLYAKDQLDTLEGVSEEEKNKFEIKTISFTYHQLRHTYVCILHKAGIDIKQAQIWTGHRDVKVLLNIYTHLDAEDNKLSTDKLNQFLA